jgi:hypothetical protein
VKHQKTKKLGEASQRINSARPKQVPAKLVTNQGEDLGSLPDAIAKGGLPASTTVHAAM